MKSPEQAALEYFALRDGHTVANLQSCVRRARRDCLTDVLAWCHQNPDAPAQGAIRFIHDAIIEGEL